MARQHDFNVHLEGTLHHRVEIIYLEPEQHTVAIGSVGAIADGAVVVLDFKVVQLQDERAVHHQLLILLAAVSPTTAQQALIPAAAGFYICETNERLRTHGCHAEQNPR